MEHQNLDDLSRALARHTEPWSRRGVARLLAAFSMAGALGVWIGLPAEAKKQRGQTSHRGPRSEKAKTKNKNRKKNRNRHRNHSPATPITGSAPGGGIGGGSCNPGLTLCGEFCADKNTDLGHCGACNNLCNPGQVCRDGNCVAPPYRNPPSYCDMSDGGCYMECFTSCDPFGDAPRGVCARLCRNECRCSPPPPPPWTCHSEDNSFNRNLCLGALTVWQKACEAICAAVGGPIAGECKNGCKLVAEESAKSCPPDTIDVC